MLHSNILKTTISNPKTLIILHGLFGMSDNWKTLANQYAQQGFEVHLIDLRNHGRSFHTNVFNYAVMVEDIILYCKSYNLLKINIIGHSMGGKVAMLLATTHPDLINKLIIADISPKYYPEHHQTILQGLNAVDFDQKPSRNEVENILANYITDFGTRQFLSKNLYWKTPNQLDFRFNLPVLTAQIAEVGVALPPENHFNNPTLFIRGGNSDYILDDDFGLITHHFPQSTITTIDGVGHWLHAEKPVDFLAKTVSFLGLA